jgi:hypothetical protein
MEILNRIPSPRVGVRVNKKVPFPLPFIPSRQRRGEIVLGAIF